MMIDPLHFIGPLSPGGSPLIPCGLCGLCGFHQKIDMHSKYILAIFNILLAGSFAASKTLNLEWNVDWVPSVNPDGI